jgi:hypothetical protein
MNISNMDTDYLDFKDLIDLTLIGLVWSEDKEKIKLTVEDHCKNTMCLTYKVSGICCSSAWINSIEGTDEVVGHKIINIIEHEYSEFVCENDYHKTPVGDIYNQGHNCLYNIEIVSSKGSCVIDFRSSCNGYYGGGLGLISVEKSGD